MAHTQGNPTGFGIGAQGQSLTGMAQPDLLGQIAMLQGLPQPPTAQQHMTATPVQQFQQQAGQQNAQQALQSAQQGSQQQAIQPAAPVTQAGQAATGGQEGAGGGFNAAQIAGGGLTGLAGIVALINALRDSRDLDSMFEPAIQDAQQRAALAANRRGLTGGAGAAFETQATQGLQRQLALARQQQEQQRNQALIQGLAQLGMLGAGIATGNPALAMGGAGVPGSAAQFAQAQGSL